MKKKKIVLAAVTILIASLSIIFVYFYAQLNKISKVEIPKTDSELNISNNAVKEDDGIVNIALLGLDRRVKDEVSRSDALMILTLDKKHKKIKISSIMRDSYVNIDGHEKTKINHAYAYGGPTLAIKTLNKNFDLNIRNYITVDFFGFEKIIDSLGGVDINITSEEIQYINPYIEETSRLQNEQAPFITNAGLQKLNGRQAIAYARVRYTAGGDFERTQRQRIVLVDVLNKIKTINITNIPNIVSQLLPYTETRMSNTEIIKLMTSIYMLGISNIEQERFPVDGYCNEKMINGTSYLVFDLDATKNQIHKYIFEDIKP